jgi:ESCRT-II complex subunit VPS22
LATFKENLEEFAKKHKKDINKNPHFRAQFQKMCAKVGVDPLASNKGFWAEILGVGDFYYELGVQIIDVCISTRKTNGGLITIEELLRRLKQIRSNAKGSQQEISFDDVRRAVSKIKCLGNGYEIVDAGNQPMIVSVPMELNKDHVTLINLAQDSCYVTMKGAAKELKWTEKRVQAILEMLLKEGMVWIDTQVSDKEVQFWFPSLFSVNE